MPPVSDDQKIRKGLKFIAKANKAVIEASIPLEVLEGDDDPPGILELMKRYTFTVEGVTYHGRLTVPQATYLNGQTGSLATFAKAVVAILVQSSTYVANALVALDAALEAPGYVITNQIGTGPIIPPPSVGGCTVDGDCYNCSVTYCEQGLQGSWSQTLCEQKPPAAKSKAAPAK